MNYEVRAYLIEIARQKDKFCFYSDVVRDCNLGFDLTTEYGKNQLSATLGAVSSFEYQHGRPLLSSLAIYKDERRNDHGDGYYKVAESLGIGKFKALKEQLHGFAEAEKCRQYWQNEEHYKQFAVLDKPAVVVNGPEFFNRTELEFFKRWQLQPYDPYDDEHVEAKDYLMDTVWEKSIQLGKMIIAQRPDFDLDGKRIWHQRGWKEIEGENVQAAIFKPYTWIKVFRKTDRGRDIYFTFGVDAYSEAFIYKIDCRSTRDSKLTEEQIKLCKELTPHEARWAEISFDDLLMMDWGSLTKLCVEFMDKYLERYDAIIAAVWGSPISPIVFKNTLLRRQKPTDGVIEFPPSSLSSQGVKHISYVMFSSPSRTNVIWAITPRLSATSWRTSILVGFPSIISSSVNKGSNGISIL